MTYFCLILIFIIFIIFGFLKSSTRYKYEIPNTVVITGSFDILHQSHIEILKFAKSQGTKLIVLIDSDENIKRNKGKDRPVIPQEQRKKMLESIRYVDQVDIFLDEEDLEYILGYTLPDVRVVGSDWKGKTIVGEKYCKHIVYYDRIDNISTTNIVNKIKNI